MRNSKQILLVEDDALVSAFEKENLEKYGYDVLSVETGELALDILRQKQDIEIVLMDMDLGDGIDGMKTAELILEKQDIPIVFVSNYTEEEISRKIDKISSYGYVVKSSNFDVLVATMKMAMKSFNSRKMEEETIKRLQAENELLKACLESSNHILIMAIDKNYKYLSFNKEYKEFIKLYYSIDIEIDMNLLELISDEFEKNQTKKNIEISLRGELHSTVQVYEKGCKYYFESIYSPIRNSRKEIIGVTNYIRDITDRINIELDIQKSKQFSESIIKSLPGIFYIIDNNGNIVDVNDKFLSVSFYSREEILKMHALDFFAEQQKILIEDKIKEVFEVGESNVQAFFVRKDGIQIPYYFTGYRAQLDNNTFLLGLGIDYSEQYKAQEKIKLLLSEKEIILKEVHHRMKNNMLTVKSLFSLQAQTLKDQIAIDALEDAGSRVQSMMILYDNLFQSSNFKEVLSVEYISSLVDKIFENFPHSQAVTIVKKIDEFIIPVNKILSLGIIINEILTNIMKYAFLGRSEGIILVTATSDDSTYSISIQDNGNGMPDTIDFKNSPGFGLMLIQMLTKQLDGHIQIIRENGTKIVMEFQS